MPGLNGSPVIDSNGCLIGIMSQKYGKLEKPKTKAIHWSNLFPTMSASRSRPYESSLAFPFFWSTINAG